jgi:hypothetical protein
MPRYGARSRANAIHWGSANPLTFEAARRHALASRNTLGSSLCANFALSHAAKVAFWRMAADTTLFAKFDGEFSDRGQVYFGRVGFRWGF